MVSSIDTDFLIEIRAQMEREIITIENILEDKQKTFSKLTAIILNSCDHDWTYDYIDTICSGHCQSERIKYCTKCELTDTTMST